MEAISAFCSAGPLPSLDKYQDFWSEIESQVLCRIKMVRSSGIVCKVSSHSNNEVDHSCSELITSKVNSTRWETCNSIIVCVIGGSFSLCGLGVCQLLSHALKSQPLSVHQSSRGKTYLKHKELSHSSQRADSSAIASFLRIYLIASAYLTNFI